MNTRDSFGALAELSTSGGKVGYYRLGRLDESGLGEMSRLPYCIRVLLESVLRSEDGFYVTPQHVEALASYDGRSPGGFDIPFKPARVLLQDFTGVPCLVDLAAMRSAVGRLGGDPQRINPVVPVDLVIDHSVQVDAFGSSSALGRNSQLEFERNRERYEFLHWGQRSFDNLRVVPPSGGICHQVNLEFLAPVVQMKKMGDRDVVMPDSLVGTDSHTTMINGLGVVGWGVGGIEAEAVMLDRPLFMTAPAVVGFELLGQMAPAATATDLVLTVTQMLRAHGVVGKFVEFFGPGLASLTVPDRATIANMSPEYGATMGYFPVDDRTLQFLRATGRTDEQVDLVERYLRAQGLFRTDDSPRPVYEASLELDLSSVEPCMAGPRRPQDRIALSAVGESFREGLGLSRDEGGFGLASAPLDATAEVASSGGGTERIGHGAVVIAAITSCTNTSNPSVMLAAGLLARNAVKKGLTTRAWVKTSLAPGSRVVTRYLDEAGLTPYLDELGFHTVGYGCTTCIGNSGPLPEAVGRAVEQGELVVASVISGNRNFEGRIHQKVKASYLASPPLVVAHAIAGRVDIDLTTEPVGTGSDGEPVMLAEIWPAPEQVDALMKTAQQPDVFRHSYGDIDRMSDAWNRIESTGGAMYRWDESSTYINEPPFFTTMTREITPITSIDAARVLVMVGDSITTDHISPAGAIAANAPAGAFLSGRGIERRDFNTYGSRRGDDRVMTRGTFANIRLRNLLAPGTEGGFTTRLPDAEVTTIYEASRGYLDAAVPTIVLAGKDYGMGSSRDWAAKGTLLLGVRAVIAESFERIHRSNLVGMGVLPLQFSPGQSAERLGLTGREIYSVRIDDDLSPGAAVEVVARSDDGSELSFIVTCRLDSPVDVEYYRNGGILHSVLRDMIDG